LGDSRKKLTWMDRMNGIKENDEVGALSDELKDKSFLF
jgi:hypothetical protein